MYSFNVYLHRDDPIIPDEKQQENKVFLTEVLNTLFVIVKMCYSSTDGPLGLAGWQEIPAATIKEINDKYLAKDDLDLKILIAEKLQESCKLTGNLIRIHHNAVGAQTLIAFTVINSVLSKYPVWEELLGNLMGGMYFLGQLSAFQGIDQYAESVETYFWDKQLNAPLKEMEELLKLHPEDQELYSRLETMKNKVSELKNDMDALDRHIHRLHCEYDDVDKWATVPDCVAVMADMLSEDSFGGKASLFSPESCRVNIQKRLRSLETKSLSACNAMFYQTIDIATEAAKELEKYSTGQYLKEFNVIASPHNDLRRASKSRKD